MNDFIEKIEIIGLHDRFIEVFTRVRCSMNSVRLVQQYFIRSENVLKDDGSINHVKFVRKAA